MELRIESDQSEAGAGAEAPSRQGRAGTEPLNHGQAAADPDHQLLLLRYLVLLGRSLRDLAAAVMECCLFHVFSKSKSREDKIHRYHN